MEMYIRRKDQESVDGAALSEWERSRKELNEKIEDNKASL
jgi:hypothetical protein